eukprot:XP_001691055.1 predicted protein [Chlamydomonas reinhardtii]
MNAAQGGAAPQGAEATGTAAVNPKSTTVTPPSAALGHLKEALRILENTHTLFTGMKAKVVYACGEGHLLAADDGRQYLARVIKVNWLCAASSAFASAAPSSAHSPLRAVELLGVLLRVRALDGPAGGVRMLLPGVFVANVLLEAPGSAVPLRVVVDAADRAFDLDPWATPTPQVFRRLSALATRVLAYFIKRAPLNGEAAPAPGSSGVDAPAAASSPTRPLSAAAGPSSPGSPPGANGLPTSVAAPVAVPAAEAACAPGPSGSALEDLLLWLLGCRDLFSKRCAATGRLMAWDPLPREELRLRALDLSRVAAYHMHVAPVEQLGWAEDVPAQAALALAGQQQRLPQQTNEAIHHRLPIL